nr:MAG TPA: hypothetical protein [Caudoviricetes sp.]
MNDCNVLVTRSGFILPYITLEVHCILGLLFSRLTTSNQPSSSIYQ